MITYLKFEMNGCEPCKQTDNFIKAQTELVPHHVKDASELDNLEQKLYVVNVEEFPELAGQYQIMSVPTFVKLEDGEEVVRSRFSGLNYPKIIVMSQELSR